MAQAETLFSELDHGFESGDARVVMSCIDEGYDCFARWPDLLLFSSPGPEPPATEAERRAGWRKQGREAAADALKRWFFRQMLDRDLRRSFDATVHGIVRQEDGDYAATVTIGFRLDNGSHLGALDPPAENLRFILRRRGFLFPRLRILHHAPIRYRQ